MLTSDLGAVRRARGLPVGQRAQGRDAARRARRPVRAAGRDQAGAGRLRAGDVHQRGGRADHRPSSPRGPRSTRHAAERAERAARTARAQAGPSGGRGAAARPTRPRSSSTRSSSRDDLPAGAALRADARRREINDPRFVSRSSSTPTGAAGTPKARFAYLFPNRNSALIQVRLRPDSREHERRDGDRADPRGGARCRTGGCRTAADVRRHGRAGRRRATWPTRSATRSLRLLVAALVVMALTLALVFRARLRLLPLVVALAAAALTFGGAVAGRRVADDGLDRRAAGAHRPGGRLRDPAAVAGRGGGAGGARRGAARRVRPRGRARRARRWPPPRRPRRRASSCSCSRRCRWSAASACCSSSASCSPSAAR